MLAKLFPVTVVHQCEIYATSIFLKRPITFRKTTKICHILCRHWVHNHSACISKCEEP